MERGVSRREQRRLGGQGLVVFSQGLACMGMSFAYGRSDDEESSATIRHALDLGVAFLDTADVYGPGTNEELGLSEASGESIRKAHATHPVSALQTEYSLFSREPEEAGLLETVRELDIGFVTYSSLGRGFLSGRIRSVDDLPADDWRRTAPRFRGENFDRNLQVVDRVRELAESKGITSSQLALAWVLARGADVVPIPGTKRRGYLEENVAASEVTLTERDLASIDEVAPRGVAAGPRYDEQGVRTVNV